MPDLEAVPDPETTRWGLDNGLGRVAVVGGGIGGLAAAHFLTAAGAEVTLYESSDRFGGLATFFEYEGSYLERFYHVMLPNDEHLLPLLGELGLRDSVYWSETSLGFFHQRRLFRLDRPIDLLRFTPTRLIDRIRLGLSAVWASHLARPGPLDDITIEAWLTRLAGRRAFAQLYRPLLEAKFGDAYKQMPALWYWSRFGREKGTGKETKGYVTGGYKAITDRLVESLRRRGARLELDAPVERLDLEDGGEGVQISVGGRQRRFDRLVSTVPIVALRKIAAGGGVERWLERLPADIDYQGVINVIVLLRRQLTSHYWIPCVESGVPFQGIVETTRAIRLEDTGGRHLVYLLNYVHRTHPLHAADPEKLKRDYVAALFDLFPDLRPDDVIDSFLFRAPFVEPVYTPGYGKRKPPFELVPRRLFLATTTQVYPAVTSWNSSTRVSKEAVAAMIAAAGGGAA